MKPLDKQNLWTLFFLQSKRQTDVCLLMEISLNVLTEFAEFSDKKNSKSKMRIVGLESMISCVRDRDDTTRPRDTGNRAYPYTEPDSCFSDSSDSLNLLNLLNSAPFRENINEFDINLSVHKDSISKSPYFSGLFHLKLRSCQYFVFNSC